MRKNNEQLTWRDFSTSMKWATGSVFAIMMAGTGTLLAMTGAKYQEFENIKRQVSHLQETAVSREKLRDTILPLENELKHVRRSIDRLEKTTEEGIKEILRKLQ